MISPVGMLASVGAAGAANSGQACNIHAVGLAIGAAGNPASPQSVETFAEQSPQYLGIVADGKSTYIGYASDWSINQSDCSVTWQNASANFLVQNSTGAKYVLVVDENPNLGLIYNVSREAVLDLGIPTTTANPTYSGYEIANSSSPTSVPVTYAEADWTVPSVSAPTGSGAPSCDYTSGEAWKQCLVTDWVGLQNSTYEGNESAFTTGVGEVLQTGTIANYTCSHSGSPCYSSELPFTGYLRASTQYTFLDNHLSYCSFGGHDGSIGDSITGEVGSNSQIGLSGSNYTDLLVDWTYGSGEACTSTWATTGTYQYVHTPEIYADYIAERPSTGGFPGTPTALPKFANTEFYDLEMGTGTGHQLNPYWNYNNDWGNGLYMKNEGTTLTTTGSMSSVGGDFYVDWSSSYNT